MNRLGTVVEEGGEAEQVMDEPFLLLSNGNFEDESRRYRYEISSSSPLLFSFRGWHNLNISVVSEATLCIGIQRKICIFHLTKGQRAEGSPGYVLACRGTFFFFPSSSIFFFAIETGVQFLV